MKRCVSMLVAALAAFACLALPASAQVPGGLWRFGTTGAYAPQAGDCVSILAMNSSGQNGDRFLGAVLTGVPLCCVHQRDHCLHCGADDAHNAGVHGSAWGVRSHLGVEAAPREL